MTGIIGTTADRGYAICTSGRSGSNLLCQYLASTGLLGRPREYFNAPGRRMFDDPDYPDGREKQIEQVLTTGATANGIYGIKMFPEYIDAVAEALPWTQRLPNLRFVLLRRHDLLGQAISFVRGLQTSQWRSTVPAQDTPSYDGDLIYERLRGIVRDYARWELFFARNGIAPARVAYETLVDDPQGCVDQVAGMFGLAGRTPIDRTQITLQVQRDALTEEWRARFLAERRDLDRMDAL